MAGFAFERFFGIIPREHPANLTGGYAEIAHNVRLDNGTIRPWRELKRLDAVIPETAKTVYQFGCCWMAWDACVDVAEWRPTCHRIYVTGSAPFPVMTEISDKNGECQIGSDCCPGWSRVGVQVPTTAIVATPVKPVEDTETRKDTAYVYTYKNCWCEESAPSPVSNQVTTNEGTDCILTGFVPPDPEWCITDICIYRLETGAYDGSEKVALHPTNFFHIATIPITDMTFTDNVPTYDIGSALSTREMLPPPQTYEALQLRTEA